MLYDLRRADVRIKWLVTGLLATLGLSYVFGAVMVALYAGFTPQSVAATYAGPEMSMAMPPETTMVVHRPMSMADFAGMWLTKLASPRFAIVTLAGGWAMAVAYLVVAALAVHQMWLSPERG